MIFTFCKAKITNKYRFSALGEKAQSSPLPAPCPKLWTVVRNRKAMGKGKSLKGYNLNHSFICVGQISSWPNIWSKNSSAPFLSTKGSLSLEVAERSSNQRLSNKVERFPKPGRRLKWEPLIPLDLESVTVSFQADHVCHPDTSPRPTQGPSKSPGRL